MIIWFKLIWFYTIECNLIWYNWMYLIWYNWMRFDLIQFNAISFDTIQFDLVIFDASWFDQSYFIKFETIWIYFKFITCKLTCLISALDFDLRQFDIYYVSDTIWNDLNLFEKILFRQILRILIFSKSFDRLIIQIWFYMYIFTLFLGQIFLQ